MAYAVLFIDSGVHFIAGFVSSHDAWEFSRECDSAGIDAGFPFPVDGKTGKPLTCSEIIALHMGV